jgi:small redox-active disulfide protein 2
MKTIKIEVLGSGCTKCKKLFELTKEVALELGIKDSVEYSTDVSKIVAMGVMSSPVLAINDKSVLSGILPTKEKLNKIISDYISNPKNEKSEGKGCCGCSCGGNC